jgi:hypothetical protein
LEQSIRNLLRDARKRSNVFPEYALPLESLGVPDEQLSSSMRH